MAWQFSKGSEAFFRNREPVTPDFLPAFCPSHSFPSFSPPCAATAAGARCPHDAPRLRLFGETDYFFPYRSIPLLVSPPPPLTPCACTFLPEYSVLSSRSVSPPQLPVFPCPAFLIWPFPRFRACRRVHTISCFFRDTSPCAFTHPIFFLFPRVSTPPSSTADFSRGGFSFFPHCHGGSACSPPPLGHGGFTRGFLI